MSDLAVAPRQSSVVPANEWLLINKQAEMLAQSDIIPKDYRRKPANIVVAALTGRTHGWDVLTAMRNGHVIEGTWGMKPEAMLGLVRAAGHHVDIELVTGGAVEHRGAIVTAHREGESPMVVTFLVQDALDIGLVQMKNGALWARSQDGKRKPWEQYPVDMCMWRAVGKACRAKYSDITLGIYSVEELGAAIDADGEVIEDLGPIEHTREPVALGAEAMGKFVEACEQNGVDPSEVMRRAFPGRVLDDPVLDTELPHLRDTFRVVVEEHAAEVQRDRTEEVLAGEADSTEPDPPARVVDVPGPDNFVNDEIAEGVVVPGDSVPPAPVEVRPASRTQVGKIKGEYDRLGVTDRDTQLSYTATIVGREVPTHNALNTDEASGLIECLVQTESLDG